MPAMRSLFFVALDENNMSVKRMQSFFTVQPGETVGCAGCHEKRTKAPRIRPISMALMKKPAKIEPIRDLPEILDYPRDIQPILNRNCLSCHNQEKHEGDVILSGELLGLWQRFSGFSRSYWVLMEPARKLIAHGENGNGNRPPRSIGTSASRLLKFIDGSHQKVKVSDLERKTIMLWIEVGANYAGTYGSLWKGAARFDAASGFRPTWQYMVEMKRYGILPESFDINKDPIDCYAVDQAYWKSFWYKSPITSTERKR
jgi:hypothetical protein